MTLRRVAGMAVALFGAAVSLAPVPASAQRRPAVASIQITPPEPQVEAGKTITLYATAYDVGNNLIGEITDFHWTSNSGHATIDQNGTATGVSAGVATITARYGTGARAKASQVTLTVTAPGGQPQPQAATQPAAARGARGRRPASDAPRRNGSPRGTARRRAWSSTRCISSW